MTTSDSAKTSPPEPPVTEADLHAYADGQLSAHRLGAVIAFLAEHPQDAAQVAEWQAQNAALRAMFTKEAAATSQTDQLLLRQAKRRSKAVPMWKMAVASSLLLITGGLAGVMLAPVLHPKMKGVVAYGAQLADESAANFKIYSREKTHPVEVWADQKDHLVRWLKHTVGEPVMAPDLTDYGFKLVGGRLVTFQGKPSALMMYENASGIRVTILTCRNMGERPAPLALDREGDITTTYWSSLAASYAISGPIEPNQMQSVADAVLKQSQG